MSPHQNTYHIICWTRRVQLMYFNILCILIFNLKKNYISPSRQQPHPHRGIKAAITAKLVTRLKAMEPAETSKLSIFGN